MNIRLPSQSIILAGESPEVDSLVSRATMIDGSDRGRAVVPVEITAELLNATSRQPPSAMRLSAGYGRSLSRPSSPTELYRSVQRFGGPLQLQEHLDVFA